jgi:ribosomal protein S18 acetylase RimI-like enzyme
MAALRESILPSLELVELKRVTGRELDPTLLEETVEWQTGLDWDFSRSADLVRQYADMRALNGYVLLDRGEVAGYGYSVLEDHKGLVGDIYVRPPWRASDGGVRLLRATLRDLMETPQVRRIESQLMLADTAMGRILAQEGRVGVYERMLMAQSAEGAELPLSAAGRYFVFEQWSEHHSELAAETIMLAYQNHLDSKINDQYRSMWGARRFLHNIVQYPGCGNFYRPGSFVAFDPATGTLAGVVLASFVHASTGHVTQLCVAPRAKGRGVGYELLRRAVNALRVAGAAKLSLTVTVGNSGAIGLYERCGFREARRFLAYAWDRE